MYEQFIPNDFSIKNYELGKSLLDVRKYIAKFYQNNLSGICVYERSNALRNVYLLSLFEMLSTTGNPKFDSRGQTVEIIVNTSIKIEQALEAIVVPRTFLRNETVLEFTDKNPNLKVITYREEYPINPLELNGYATHALHNYLETTNQEDL